MLLLALLFLVPSINGVVFFNMVLQGQNLYGNYSVSLYEDQAQILIVIKAFQTARIPQRNNGLQLEAGGSKTNPIDNFQTPIISFLQLVEFTDLLGLLQVFGSEIEINNLNVFTTTTPSLSIVNGTCNGFACFNITAVVSSVKRQTMIMNLRYFTAPTTFEGRSVDSYKVKLDIVYDIPLLARTLLLSKFAAQTLWNVGGTAAVLNPARSTLLDQSFDVVSTGGIVFFNVAKMSEAIGLNVPLLTPILNGIFSASNSTQFILGSAFDIAGPLKIFWDPVIGSDSAPTSSLLSSNVDSLPIGLVIGITVGGVGVAIALGVLIKILHQKQIEKRTALAKQKIANREANFVV